MKDNIIKLEATLLKTLELTKGAMDNDHMTEISEAFLLNAQRSISRASQQIEFINQNNSLLNK